MSVYPSPATTYDAFAAVYDFLTRDQDHEWWWSEMLPLATAAGLPGGATRALDVACGTGKSIAPLRARGWEVVGVDVSAGMLAEARSALGPEVPLLQHDMTELPVLGAFDLVSVLNDAINYLLDPRQLNDALVGFHDNLVPGGVLVFDVDTLAGLRNMGTLVQQEPGRIVMVEGDARSGLEPGAVTHAELIVLEQRQGFYWDSRRIPHVQRHLTGDEIRTALAGAGFELHGVYGLCGRTITPDADEQRDEKAIYVSRRP